MEYPAKSCSKASVVRGVSLARLQHDYEMALIEERTRRSPQRLMELAQTVIMTLGDQSSRIVTRDGRLAIPSAPARRVLEVNGTGDAYPAGIVSALLHRQAPEVYDRVASLGALYPVGEYGTCRLIRILALSSPGRTSPASGLTSCSGRGWTPRCSRT